MTHSSFRLLREKKHGSWTEPIPRTVPYREYGSSVPPMKRSALLLVAALVALPVVPAWAHTEFESSTPADQESIEVPVTEITVTFTLPVTIVGNGFEVLDPEGNIISPEVETGDDTVFKLLLDEPLAGGEAGVRYEVAAEDGHVLAGGFSFTVAAPSTTTTSTLASTTTVENVSTSSSAPSTSSTIGPTASLPDEGDGGGSMTPLLIVIGVAAVGGAGLYAGMRSHS
jgi:copper transport protein